MIRNGMEPIHQKKIDILAVEDGLDNQLLLQLFLKQYPCNMDMARDGEEAVLMFVQKQYDVVLMDMVMPVKDGYTATKEIRAIEKEHQRRPAHIVALTANTSDKQVRRCMMVGCNHFLHKPIDHHNLIELLNRIHSEPVELVLLKEDLKDLIPQYIVNRYMDLHQIPLLLEKGDFEGVELIAHKMKGSGSGYGLDTVSRLGKIICTASSLKQLDVIKDAVRELESYLSHVEVIYFRHEDEEQEL